MYTSHLFLPGFVTHANQVARALQMHETGCFVLNQTPFSNKDFGKDTAVYLKLINKLSTSRWTDFYSELKTTTMIAEKLKAVKLSPESHLEDESEEYHIRDSDPVDPDVVEDVDVE